MSQPKPSMDEEMSHRSDINDPSIMVESASAAPAEILVSWDGPDDPDCPQNMPRARKWLITLVFGSVTVWVTFSSSVFSPAVAITAEEYHVSNEVTTLGTSLTVWVCFDLVPHVLD